MFGIELLRLLSMNRLLNLLPKIAFLRFHRVFFLFKFLILFAIIYYASISNTLAVSIWNLRLENLFVFLLNLLDRLAFILRIIIFINFFLHLLWLKVNILWVLLIKLLKWWCLLGLHIHFFPQIFAALIDLCLSFFKFKIRTNIIIIF